MRIRAASPAGGSQVRVSGGVEDVHETVLLNLANAAAMNSVISTMNSVSTALARPRPGSCRPGPALIGTMMTRTAVEAMATYRVAPRAASPAGSSSKTVGKPRQQRHRQDPRGPGAGTSRLPAWDVCGIHHRNCSGARADGGQGRKTAAESARQLSRLNLLIIDELSFVPLSTTGAELLFEVFSQRYERGSILVTTNLPFDEWTEVFGSERLTGALLDRLTHHVHILEMNGESYRLKHSRENAVPASDEPQSAVKY